MEQYEIEKRLLFRCLKKAVTRFNPEHIFVRLKGSSGGTTMLSENLKKKKLTIIKKRNGLSIVIGGKEKFFYETSAEFDYGKRWAVAYERIRFDPDGPETGVLHLGVCAYPNPHEPYTGPEDPNLPPVSRTIFRSANMKYLIEITFPGKIRIRPHRKMPGYPGWFYWTIE